MMRIFDLIFAFAYVGGGDMGIGFYRKPAGIPWEFQFFCLGCSIFFRYRNYDDNDNDDNHSDNTYI